MSVFTKINNFYDKNEWAQHLTSAAGGIAGAAIGGGYNEGAGGVFSAMQPLAQFLPGPFGAVASIGLGLGQRMFGYKLNKENINNIENNIKQQQSFTSNVGDFDSLSQNILSAPTDMSFNKSDVGKDGWFNKGATRYYNKLMKRQQDASDWIQNTLTNNQLNLQMSQAQGLRENYRAAGGPLFMKNILPLSPFGNRFNYGGMSALATHGADWNNGLKFINVGGSHEENPYEGVQMGVDQEGTPNLVEEGEVIWNDYVFSNRMTVPKRIKEKLGLKGMNDITYAEAAKKIQKEAEERPNDPISKRGLDATLSRLAYAQEEDRQRKQEEEQQQAIMAAYGGELAIDETSKDNEYSDGGKIHIKESKKGTFTKAATEHGMGVQEFASKVLANKDDYSPAMVKKANFAKNASKWHAYGGELGNLFLGLGDRPNSLLFPSPFMEGTGPQPFIKPDALSNSEYQWFAQLSPLNRYRVMEYYDKPGQNLNWTRQTLKDINNPAIGNGAFIRNWTKNTNGDTINIVKAAYNNRNKETGSFQMPKDVNYTITDLAQGLNTPHVFNTSYTKLNPNKPPEIKVTYPEKGWYYRANNNNGGSFWDKIAGYLRYAPVIGSAINVFTDLAGLTNKPDYSNADSLMAATQNLRDVRPPSIGDYVRYTPFDRMFYLNQLNANAGATRRGLMDIAGGNRGAAMAGLLASDYNTLGKIGELARQAEEYNLANRFKTAEFNRGTNQFNSEMDLKAQMANNQNSSIKLDVLSKAAAIRDAIDARIGAARSANLTGLFDNLGAIGEDYINRKERDMLIRSGVFGTLSERPYGWDDKDWNTYKDLLKKYNRGNSRE